MVSPNRMASTGGSGAARTATSLVARTASGAEAHDAVGQRSRLLEEPVVGNHPPGQPDLLGPPRADALAGEQELHRGLPTQSPWHPDGGHHRGHPHADLRIAKLRALARR